MNERGLVKLIVLSTNTEIKSGESIDFNFDKYGHIIDESFIEIEYMVTEEDRDKVLLLDLEGKSFDHILEKYKS